MSQTRQRSSKRNSDDRASEEIIKKAARLFNVSPQAIYDAKTICEKDPELFEAIREGKSTILEAKKRLGLTPERWNITLDLELDQDIINYYPRKTRSKAVKEALRFYVRHKRTIH